MSCPPFQQDKLALTGTCGMSIRFIAGGDLQGGLLSWKMNPSVSLCWKVLVKVQSLGKRDKHYCYVPGKVPALLQTETDSIHHPINSFLDRIITRYPWQVVEIKWSEMAFTGQSFIWLSLWLTGNSSSVLPVCCNPSCSVMSVMRNLWSKCISAWQYTALRRHYCSGLTIIDMTVNVQAHMCRSILSMSKRTCSVVLSSMSFYETKHCRYCLLGEVLLPVALIQQTVSNPNWPCTMSRTKVFWINKRR